jgi:hypothetical protein
MRLVELVYLVYLLFKGSILFRIRDIHEMIAGINRCIHITGMDLELISLLFFCIIARLG